MCGGFDPLQFPPPENALRFRRELKTRSVNNAVFNRPTYVVGISHTNGFMR